MMGDSKLKTVINCGSGWLFIGQKGEFSYSNFEKMSSYFNLRPGAYLGQTRHKEKNFVNNI